MGICFRCLHYARSSCKYIGKNLYWKREQCDEFKERVRDETTGNNNVVTGSR